MSEVKLTALTGRQLVQRGHALLRNDSPLDALDRMMERVERTERTDVLASMVVTADVMAAQWRPPGFSEHERALVAAFAMGVAAGKTLQQP